MRDGVIYVAFGQRYAEEAIFSAETAKSHSNVNVTLFTDTDVKSSHLDSVVRISPKHKRAKVDFISKSPYERTLYLDSDTKIVRDFSDVFKLLDKFDLAAVQDHSRKSSRWSGIPEYRAIPYAFPEFNGGVILFRNSPAVEEFFECWKKYFYRYEGETQGQDQASFRIALWESDIRLHSLPFEYNVRNQKIRDKMSQRASSPEDEGLLKPRILHWHGLNKRHLLWFRAKYRPMRY